MSDYPEIPIPDDVELLDIWKNHLYTKMFLSNLEKEKDVILKSLINECSKTEDARVRKVVTMYQLYDGLIRKLKGERR